MLPLDVSRLKRSDGETARYEVEAVLPPFEALGEIVEFAGPIKAVLDVVNESGVLAARGEVLGKLMLTCSRCTEKFVLDFNLEFREDYVSGQEEAPLEAVVFNGDVIDIAPEVIKGLLLILPMKPLCRPDCQGLCALCGANLNKGECGCHREEIDPRLEKLKELLKG